MMIPRIYTEAVDAGWILRIPPVYHTAVPASWPYLGVHQGHHQWGVRPDQLPEVWSSGLAPLCDPPLPITEKIAPAVYASPRSPFPHQAQGVAWLAPKPRVLLEDEQGLGKTKTVIDTIRYRRSQGISGPVLVVTKRSILDTWLDEIRLNDPDATIAVYKRADPFTPTAQWTLTTYDYLRRDYIPKTAAIHGALATPWHTVVLDEVHQIRNPQAQRTRAILRLRAEWKMALTGTPMVNSFMDLWAPLFWLEQTKQRSHTFGATFGVPDLMGNWVINPQRLPQLHQLQAPIVLRRTKAETLDLPPKLVETQWVSLSPAQQRAYKEAKEEFRVTLDGEETPIPNILSRLLRFKQITGGLHLLGGDPSAHAKWDAFMDRFEDFLNAGEKLVLFTQFRRQWNFLMEQCAPWHPVGLHGGMSPADRTVAVQQFQTDPATQVFVMTHAGREGITLTAAHTMVFFDLEWSPAWFDQATDRIHRIGQTGTVNIVRLLARNTIDEKTLRVNLEEKATLQKILTHPLQYL